MNFAHPLDEHRVLHFVPPFEQWCGTTDDSIRAGLARLATAGARGIVVTVSLENYLRDDGAWAVLRRGVQAARESGFRVWIYDEKGYPSGAAGGLVLARLPDAEAQGLVRHEEANGEARYDTVTLYEGTHATCNFYEKRRYVNILDPDAVALFIAETHDRYARALQPIGEYVEAFFTDEPSLISAHVPKGKAYPQTLPWHPWLPDLFRFRKGYDLLPHRESLFRDTGEIDRHIRCDFYEVIADLCADTYFGQIRQWCRQHRVASSGHLLGEETMVWQTLFNGDPFRCYRRMDIPGIDMILSDPGKIMDEEYFLVPKVAGSAAHLQGKRRVMCEISDFLGAQDGHHASLAEMKCTAAILCSLGVSDFVSMYPLSLSQDRPPGKEPPGKRFSAAEFRRWADYVARLNAVFSEGTIATRIAVVYPIASVRAHFTPSGHSMYEPHPDPVVRSVDGAFTDLCRSLLRHQTDFDVVDETILAEARIEGTRIFLTERPYDLVLLPPMDTASVQTLETIARFAKQGGSVLAHPLMPRYAAEGVEHDGHVQALMREILEAEGLRMGSEDVTATARALRSAVPPNCEVLPAAPRLLCTLIERSGEPTYFLVNTSGNALGANCTFPSHATPFTLDPETGFEGVARGAKVAEEGTSIDLVLRPFQSLFVVFRQSPASQNNNREPSA